MSLVELRRESVALQRQHKVDDKWNQLVGVLKRRKRSSKWIENNDGIANVIGYCSYSNLPKTFDKMKSRHKHSRRQGDCERYHRYEGNFRKGKLRRNPRYTECLSQTSLCRRRFAALDAHEQDFTISERLPKRE